jgi:hypothetical protein
VSGASLQLCTEIGTFVIFSVDRTSSCVIMVSLLHCCGLKLCVVGSEQGGRLYGAMAIHKAATVPHGSASGARTVTAAVCAFATVLLCAAVYMSDGATVDVSRFIGNANVGVAASAGVVTPHTDYPPTSPSVLPALVPREAHLRTVSRPHHAGVSMLHILGNMSATAGCVNPAFWEAASLEEQVPFPVDELEAGPEGFRHFRRRLAVIALWRPGDPNFGGGDSRRAVVERAQRWARLFEISYIVGGDQETFLTACNGGNVANFVTCAAHLLQQDGAAYGAMILLDATSTHYDETVCRIASELAQQMRTAKNPKSLPRELILDVEPLDALSDADVCNRQRLVRRVMGHVSARAGTTNAFSRWRRL